MIKTDSIGIITGLTVAVLILLKVTEVILVSWWFVTFLLWGPLIVILSTFVISIVKDFLNSFYFNKEDK